MVVLRCTERLRERLKREVHPDPGPSTTALGDWYANLIRFGPSQVLLFVNERSRLPLLLPALSAKHLDSVFPNEVERVLTEIGVHPDAVARECRELVPVVIARTSNRSVVGSMNDFAFMAKWHVEDQPDVSPFELWRGLAVAPILPLGGGSSIRYTREILGAAEGLTTNEFRDRGGRWR